MTVSTFRSLSIGDTLKYVGNDPTLLTVTNQYMRVIDNVPVSFATVNDGRVDATFSETDGFVDSMFPFDASLPQPEAIAL